MSDLVKAMLRGQYVDPFEVELKANRRNLTNALKYGSIRAPRIYNHGSDTINYRELEENPRLQTMTDYAMGFGGTFGGALAKTADLVKLEKAKRLMGTGKGRDAIWKETGWFKDVDGQWKFEIDDSGFRVKKQGMKANGEGPYALGDNVSHRKLMNAYGDASPKFSGMREISVSQFPQGNAKGSYLPHGGWGGEEQIAISPVFPKKKYIGSGKGAYERAAQGQKSTLLHELQHAIQNREGFSKGGSPDMFLTDKSAADEMIGLVNRNLKQISKSLDFARKYNDVGRIKELETQYQTLMDHKLRDLVPRALANPFEKYRRLAGEVEARNVQTRMNYTPAERKAKPPWTTLDVPENELIVRMLTE